MDDKQNIVNTFKSVVLTLPANLKQGRVSKGDYLETLTSQTADYNDTYTMQLLTTPYCFTLPARRTKVTRKHPLLQERFRWQYRSKSNLFTQSKNFVNEALQLLFPKLSAFSKAVEQLSTDQNLNTSNELLQRLTNTRDAQVSLGYSDRCLRRHDCPSTSVIRNVQQWWHRQACPLPDGVPPWFTQYFSVTPLKVITKT